MAVELDAVDRQLIALLQADARMTNRALAAAVGLAPSTTLARVRSLEDRGVIAGYHANINLAALGRGIEALIHVRLSPKDGPTIDSFLDHVMALDATIAAHLLSGVEDVLVHIAVADVATLRTVIVEQVSAHPVVVDEHTTLILGHLPKPVIPPV